MTSHIPSRAGTEGLELVHAGQSVRSDTNPEGANARLGLPRNKMQRVTIAFDVDGTLIDTEGFMNVGPVNLLILLRGMKNTKIVVWSGGGADYARHIVQKLGIDKYVHKFAGKTDHEVIAADIAIDDIQDTSIGKINLIVREK